MRLYNISIEFYKNRPPLKLNIILNNDVELQQYFNNYIYKLTDVMVSDIQYKEV